jgi:chitinase
MGGPGAAAGVFDGIDLDWEWPGSEGNVGNVIRPEDRENFTRLLREFPSTARRLRRGERPRLRRSTIPT